jgi:NADH-quinone oxidoreductase subunit M
VNHLLSILTAIPVLGAVMALLAPRGARVIAALTALASLALALWAWCGLGGDGAMHFVEHSAWVPALGIEYHLGVDGLGCLMLLLSAVVTLMAVVASTRVTTQPGLYFALVLLLRTLRNLYRAELFPLVSLLGAEPDSGVLPHQALGQ